MFYRDKHPVCEIVRVHAFYLPDRAKSEWLCGMNDHHSFSDGSEANRF